ncbi:hypothetical protein M3Y97_00271600 [Aphelenchoides bicaudatus]|nr:hypothetical protein M3Y97_00271600 [Aphelenchoides bicaudatus]
MYASKRSCSRYCLQFFTVVFIANGLCLVGFGLWFLLDPAKRYLLDLVDFSEDDPLLRFATYTLLVSGALTLFVAFVGCCGSIKAGRFIIGMYILFMFGLLLSAAAIITLPLVFKDKFADNRMPIYLANISQNRYYRDKWVTPLMDYIQFYQQCCGGKNGPKDYENSFWYLTNNLRGTRSFVPLSCCKQSQNGRAWDPIPIDPMCVTYDYYTKSFNSSVNIEGCHSRLEETLNNLLLMFVVIGSISAAVVILGIILSAVFYKSIRWYEYVPN